MPADVAPRIALGPEPVADWLVEAVEEGGGEVVAVEDCEALVWADIQQPELLGEVLRGAEHIRWVQLPWAGVEPFVPYFDHGRVWTCGKGVYAEPVAELALALTLAGLRHIHEYSRADSWTGQAGRNLIGANVTIVGGGGIAEALIRMLAPFRCRITVVRSRAQHMEGVDEVVGIDRLANVLPGADVVVLALALTPETEALISASELSLMESHAWLVNVARGRHIVTDDLVEALNNGSIGGAALEVTDPEPLPDGHPLWSVPNCIITPHTGTPMEMARPLLAARVSDNVARFAAGHALVGVVDTRVGY